MTTDHGMDALFKLRNFRTDYTQECPPPFIAEIDVRCTRTIKLDGSVYRCVRHDEHGGAHDANSKHIDGGLVRW